MDQCNEPCVACHKACELEPGHTDGLGKMAQTHEHSEEYLSHNRSGHAGFRVRVIHQWRPNI